MINIGGILAVVFTLILATMLYKLASDTRKTIKKSH